MSHVSFTSTKRDDDRDKHAESIQELESVRALNRSLTLYLEHLRVFRKNLTEASKNVEELTNVNKQWEDFLTMSKNHSSQAATIDFQESAIEGFIRVS